jgi:drug/metabolite transporter (DMT)-like permease
VSIAVPAAGERDRCASPAPIRIPVALALTVIANTSGNLLLSAGMKRVGEIRNWAPDALALTFVRIFTAGTIWFGIAALIVFFVLYLMLLSWADYSYVQPASAAGYALVPLTAFAIFGEPVSSARWAGIFLITVGVGLVGRTPARTTGSPTACEPASA